MHGGIVDFCGARRGRTAFVHDSEGGEQAPAAVEAAVQQVASAIAAAAG